MAKGKDPAFLFYSKDWIEDTAEYLPHEKGVLIDLMAHQHQKKSLPSDTFRLARIVGLSEEEFLKIWSVLKDKFAPDGDRLVNRKLTEVMTERSAKAYKNKIIGIFASLLRTSNLDKKVYLEIKNSFSVDDFLEVPTEQITERLTEWFYKRLKSIEDEDEDENEDINNKVPFDTFWDMYDKKVDRAKCEKKWYKLSEEIQLKILKHIVDYKQATPDKQYRKNPETYLNNKSWENEIIRKTNGAIKPSITENELRELSESILNDQRFK